MLPPSRFTLAAGCLSRFRRGPITNTQVWHDVRMHVNDDRLFDSRGKIIASQEMAIKFWAFVLDGMASGFFLFCETAYRPGMATYDDI